jgi:molybdenum cofactor cytidylyltransferase
MSRGPSLIVLAGGASSRLGQCKALVRFNGETAIRRLLRAGAQLGGEPVLVITGKHGPELAAALQIEVDRGRVQLHHNPHWSAGRTANLQLAQGLRPARDLCVAPVDCPLVSGATFRALAEAWSARGRPARGWLAPKLKHRDASAGAYGHPVIVGRDLAAELCGLGPDSALRELRARARPLLSLAVDDVAILDNLDTPQDLNNLRARDDDPASGGSG